MRHLPLRYVPTAYGVIQAAITTGIAAAIATHRQLDFGLLFLQEWSLNWLIAWLTMLPVVVFVSPLIQRLVLAMTSVPDQVS